MADTDWASECRDLLDSSQRALAVIKESPGRLEAIAGELRAIQELAGKAFERYSSEPSARFLRGLPLSHEQYYVCRAMGVHIGTARDLGLAGVDDYEVHRMLCYEDDEWVGYINVSLGPRDPVPIRVAARLGRAPEECRRRFLRPEQHEFFRKHLQDVYERFRD